MLLIFTTFRNIGPRIKKGPNINTNKIKMRGVIFNLSVDLLGCSTIYVGWQHCNRENNFRDVVS